MSDATSTRPNFVLIMTDTQATNVVGAYGHPGLRTPNIDRLAETGIKFERAYTTCPLCTPARAGLFTGIYPHTAGAWTNNLPLGDNVKTMGQRFADAGYATAYIGKWHLDGHDYFGTGQCPPGWNPAFWFDGRNYLDELAKESTDAGRDPDDLITLWRRGLASLEDLRAHDIRAEFTWAHRNGDRAIEFLRSRTEAGRQVDPFCSSSRMTSRTTRSRARRPTSSRSSTSITRWDLQPLTSFHRSRHISWSGRLPQT